MRYPKNVLEITQKAAEDHKTSVNRATESALRKIRKLSNYKTLVDILVRDAVQNLVHDARHEVNRQMRKDAGEYGTKAKVVSGKSKAVQRAARSVYCYRMAGTVLGEIYGRDLPGIAASEGSKASGHAFNSQLAGRLVKMVPGAKKVSEAVSTRKLGRIFSEIKTNLGGAA